MWKWFRQTNDTGLPLTVTAVMHFLSVTSFQTASKWVTDEGNDLS
jgi:hypothetical protein